MLVRILSDLHNEFWRYEYAKGRANQPLCPIPRLPDDKETVLVLAGDIDTAKHVYLSLEVYSHQFRHVVYVAGNHCFWGGNITSQIDSLRKDVEHLENVHVLDDSEVIIDHVRFLGGTMWTDFKNRDPFAMWDAPKRMNDYRKIRVGGDYKKLRPSDLLERFDKTFNYLKNALEDEDYLNFVVTHHAPSSMSVDEMYRHTPETNVYYYSEVLDKLEYLPVIWAHGHMHNAKDYELYGTRVICNPIGYIGDTETGSNPELVIEV